MSEAKFTAGPWQREDYSDEDGVLFEMELAGANGEAICRIDFEGVDNTAYAEADARLIAAAPDMYEALRRLVEPTPGTKKLPPWVYGIVMPVLAKAEGAQ
jgi:hypothetical protein